MTTNTFNRQTAKFLASVAQAMPELTGDEMQDLIQSPVRLQRILAVAFKKIATEDFDEGAYFQTRPGLWVDPDLQRFVGFTKKPARGIDSMSSYVLDRDTSEADIFGQPGSTKRAEVMASAVDLSQIDGLIDLQPGGVQGKLLNDGRANLFAVIGKSGELRVVPVYWHAVNCEWRVLCGPWRGRSVWRDGRQVFSNKL